MDKEITIALAGNPNSGKTTVFNNLTGAHQHVGNWPGVTVEKKEGSYSYKGYKVKVIDLPGVYGLTAYSPDEVIARNFILEGKPAVVVDIVDASNLERNLYLTIQLIELEANLVVALNMMDEIKLYYGSELEEHIKELETLIAQDEELSHRFPPRWLAIKLLEEDKEVLEKIEATI